MANSDPTDPRSALRASLLGDAQFIADIVATQKSKSRWWDSSALISGIVAVLTVALTATATYLTQRNMRAREFDLSQQADVLKQRRDITIHTAELVAYTSKGTKDRLLFAQGEYDSLPKPQRLALLDSTNTIDDRWRAGGTLNGVLLSVYYGSDSPAVTAWEDARAAMQAYCDCAEAAYEHYFRSRAPSIICGAEEKAADAALKRFWRAVGAATVPSGG